MPTDGEGNVSGHTRRGPTTGEAIFAVAFYAIAAAVLWPLGLSSRSELRELALAPLVCFLFFQCIWARPLARAYCALERRIIGRFAKTEGEVVFTFYAGGAIGAVMTLVGVGRLILWALAASPGCFFECPPP